MRALGAPGNCGAKSMENTQEILQSGKESISKEFLISSLMLPLVCVLEQFVLGIKAEEIGLRGEGFEREKRNGLEVTSV